MNYYTYADAIEHVSAYLGKDVSRYGASAVRRAIQSALLDLPTHHNWTYYQAAGRVVSVPQYSTGSVEYAEATRELTLTDGTWPTWAAYGIVYIDNVAYTVESRTSGTVLVLAEATTPGDDLDAGTSYAIVRETYPLPEDFVTGGDMVIASEGQFLEFRPQMDLISARRTNEGPGKPQYFGTVSGQARDGKMAVQFWPPPDLRYSFDFSYRRRPREAVIEEAKDGKASVTADSAVVTGTGTAFSQRHVGCVMRLSADGNPPTGRTGVRPYEVERRVLSVASATSLTLDGTVTQTLSRVAYTLSDPIDVEPGAMLNAFLRMAEKQVRIGSRMEQTTEERTTYYQSLAAARDADSRFQGSRTAGFGGQLSWYRRLAESPMVSDEA